MDYNAELRKWMSDHYLTLNDVQDIVNDIRHENKLTDALSGTDASSEISDEVPSHSSESLGDVDDSMDGDFDSAMASAGHGTDEDYGGGCYQMEDFGWAGDENLCGE